MGLLLGLLEMILPECSSNGDARNDVSFNIDLYFDAVCAAGATYLLGIMMMGTP